MQHPIPSLPLTPPTAIVEPAGRTTEAAAVESWLTVKEVATVMKTSVRSVYRAIQQRRLRATAINGRGDWRVHRIAVAEWESASRAPRPRRRSRRQSRR
jgi:excisionase family DNA binding protein